MNNLDPDYFYVTDELLRSRLLMIIMVEKVFSSLLMKYLDPDYFYVATGTIDDGDGYVVDDDIGAVVSR